MHDFAPYGVLTTDKAFCIQTWNHWLASHTGKSAADVLARNLFEVFPDLKARRLMPRFERALQGESSILSTALHGYLISMPSTARDGRFAQMQQTARIAPLIYQQQILGTII